MTSFAASKIHLRNCLWLPFLKPWHSQDLDFVNANIQHHSHLDDNYFTSQFQRRRRWRSYQKGEWEDDGVKIVKLIGQGSFDTLIGEKARKSVVKYMLDTRYFRKYIKHCKQACSLFFKLWLKFLVLIFFSSLF